MWQSLGSCEHYIKGKAVIEVALPAKAPHCQYCDYLSYQSAYERHYCRITGEWLLNFKKERGRLCPVTWEEEA